MPDLIEQAGFKITKLETGYLGPSRALKYQYVGLARKAQIL